VLSFTSKDGKSPSTAATSVETNLDAEMSNLSLLDGYESGEDGPKDAKRIRVVYVTEQISHHPPVSAYFASCPARSLELMGIDQISAKIATTTLRVSPGSLNKGIFIRITDGPGEGEQYHITHPVASVNGILRGSFYVTVGESSIITCSGGKDSRKFRSIIEYKEEVCMPLTLYRILN
jgi:oxysterol-binding protein-related protein 9/10/11